MCSGGRHRKIRAGGEQEQDVKDYGDAKLGKVPTFHRKQSWTRITTKYGTLYLVPTATVWLNKQQQRSLYVVSCADVQLQRGCMGFHFGQLSYVGCVLRGSRWPMGKRLAGVDLVRGASITLCQSSMHA
jgi:hypothetical protein